MSWIQPNRYDDIVSRHDAARILRDASNEPQHGDGDEPKPSWYRNGWVWVSIIAAALIVAWFVAAFT